MSDWKEDESEFSSVHQENMFIPQTYHQMKHGIDHKRRGAMLK